MMRRILPLLLFLALLSDPHLVARWDGPDSATISWQQQARGCLYKNGVFLSCYEAAGSYSIQFGHVGPLDAAYRPVANDVYKLVTNGQSYRASLRGRDVYLAVVRS